MVSLGDIGLFGMLFLWPILLIAIPILIHWLTKYGGIAFWHYVGFSFLFGLIPLILAVSLANQQQPTGIRYLSITIYYLLAFTLISWPLAFYRNGTTPRSKPPGWSAILFIPMIAGFWFYQESLKLDFGKGCTTTGVKLSVQNPTAQYHKKIEVIISKDRTVLAGMTKGMSNSTFEANSCIRITTVPRWTDPTRFDYTIRGTCRKQCLPSGQLSP